MALLTQTASLVRTVTATSAQITTGTLGEAGTAGQPVYLSDADNKYYLSDADSVDPAISKVDGILINGGSADDVVAIQTGGTMYPGGDCTPGMLYCLSGTVGRIEEATSSLATGNNTTLIGYGDEDNNLVLNVVETDIPIPS